MSAPSRTMVTLLTRFEAIGPVEADRFVEGLETVRAQIDSEPGNISYRIFRARDEPIVAFALEEWATQADADAHVARSGNGDAARAALALLSAPPATVVVVER